MKLISLQPFVKRPFGTTAITLLATGLLVLFMAGISVQLTQSEVGRVAFLLVRLAFKHIPPVLWLGSVLIVTLWLAVLVRIWRN
jgi:hypothetical protein